MHTRRSIRVATTLSAVLLALLPAVSHAIIACSGPVAFLAIDQIGQVVTAVGTAHNTICSTSNQGNFSIDAGTCKIFYNTLLADRLAGRDVTIYYASPALTSCAQIGMWSTQPTAYFIEQVK